MIMPGLDPEVPQNISTSKIVRMVSFNGSTPAGIAVLKTAAETMVPLARELVAKSILLVSEDANLGLTALDATEGAFFSKDEGCTAASKIPVYDRYPTQLYR